MKQSDNSVKPINLVIPGVGRKWMPRQNFACR